MTTVLRHAALLAIAAALSWWLFLYSPPRPTPARLPAPSSLSVTITPRFENQPRTTPAKNAEPSPRPVPTAAAPPVDESTTERAPPIPPPPELGAPEGVTTPDAIASDRVPEPIRSPDATAPEDEPHHPGHQAKPDNSSVEELMKDKSLLEKAKAELTGKVRKGFATVLLAAPEDQLKIARFFGEELVLVPRSALDPDRTDPVWFRLGTGAQPTIEEVRGRPPLGQYRQYRDLFDYEYRRLPAPLRALRKSVLLRSEVYLFAALIPPSEWAAVVGRRTEALAQSSRDLKQVRRLVMRYVRPRKGDYDILVQEVVFADGSRIQPNKYQGK